MHQSFVTTAQPLHLWGRVGDSGAKVLGNNFLIVSTVRGKCHGSNRMDVYYILNKEI